MFRPEISRKSAGFISHARATALRMPRARAALVQPQRAAARGYKFLFAFWSRAGFRRAISTVAKHICDTGRMDKVQTERVNF